MPAHRRYTKAQKLAAVAEAERTSLTAAAESTAIPITTLKYWFDAPEFADVRTKTRDDLSEGSIAMAIIAQAELIRRIRSGDISDQALVAAYGVGIDKAQLLSGAATARMESRDITGTLTDSDVRDAIHAAALLLGAGAERITEEAETSPEG
jgi:hypothetical protein